MKTNHNPFLDDLQWFILAGLLDHPELSVKCSSFWFADKPLRMEVFNALVNIQSKPVDLVELNDACPNVLPTQIFDLASSPRPYLVKLERMIGRLENTIKAEREMRVVEI